MSVPWAVFPHTIRVKKSEKNPRIELVKCPDCGGRADLMRRTPHPTIKGEVRTFECRVCGKKTEKSKLY